MKKAILPIALAAVAGSSAQAQDGLYYIGSQDLEGLPLTWTVGVDFVWDDNPTPIGGALATGDEATSINPYVGLSLVNITPQQTLEVYARLGAIYYFDDPGALSDDFFGQARLGLNWTRRINERLRFSSRNFVAYELEPNYAYGFATSRRLDPYWYWQTDNSVGYRWTERFATYTGFQLTGLNYDGSVANGDRFTWMVYNQFRYQLTPQSVLTFDYRYANTDADGLAADSTSHYLLAGIEHRFSPSTILVARAGAQIWESDAVNGKDGTSPFVEVALRSAINDQFSLRAFTRYGVEVYDTTRVVAPIGLMDFDERSTWRIGLSGTYSFSPMFSVFGGLDFITADFDDGRVVPASLPVAGVSPSEDIWNAYIGLSVEFAEGIYGTVSYNYTDSDSDFVGYSYDRNRISVGVRAEF